MTDAPPTDSPETAPPVFDPGRPRRLLEACPAYAPSPLVRARIADRPLWIKDETQRMGLGAFKALGGVYAVAALLGGDPETLLKGHPDRTFVCASAGNHGLAVAAGAQLFGVGCRIYLAETVPEGFADRLAAKGAEVRRAGATYEASVAAAITDAEATGATHLADGSWPGYTEPPRLVMEGYTVLAEEMRAAFSDGDWPSHVYLQAGVGGLAAAVAWAIRARWPVQPEIVVVEPDAAPCLGASHAAGRPVTVAGPVSSMGRLDCKAPSLLAWQVLTRAADRFVTVSDAQAEAAARAAPMATTPSGAAGLAALLAEVEPPRAPLVIISEGRVDAG